MPSSARAGRPERPRILRLSGLVNKCAGQALGSWNKGKTSAVDLDGLKSDLTPMLTCSKLLVALVTLMVAAPALADLQPPPAHIKIPACNLFGENSDGSVESEDPGHDEWAERTGFDVAGYIVSPRYAVAGAIGFGCGARAAMPWGRNPKLTSANTSRNAGPDFPSGPFF